MSQQINLEISDEVYAGLQRKASEMGLSAAEWIAALISTQMSTQDREVLDAGAPPKQERKGFRKYAGVLKDIGSIDNESIDADLARAYADDC